MSDTGMIMAIVIAYLWIAGGAYIVSQMKEDGVVSSFRGQTFVILTWPVIMAACLAYMLVRPVVSSIKGLFNE